MKIRLVASTVAYPEKRSMFSFLSVNRKGRGLELSVKTSWATCFFLPQYPAISRFAYSISNPRCKQVLDILQLFPHPTTKNYCIIEYTESKGRFVIHCRGPDIKEKQKGFLKLDDYCPYSTACPSSGFLLFKNTSPVLQPSLITIPVISPLHIQKQ